MSDSGGKRSLRLDFVDCQAHASTSEGAAPLVDPSRVQKSSRDPHRGLYPRPSRRETKEAAGSSFSSASASNMPTFQKASSLLKNSAPLVCDSYDDARPPMVQRQPVKKKSSSPTTLVNKITSYFEATRRLKRQRSPSPSASSSSAECGAIERRTSWNSKDRLQPVSEQPDWHSDSSSDSVIITDVFGLVPPAATDQDDEQDPFARLPNELLEQVLACIGMQDLLLTCNRVCKRWHDVIHNPHFLVHRKRYYRFKSERCSDTKAEVVAICKKHNMNEMSHCLMQLNRYMAGYRASTKGLPEVLHQHPMYKEIVYLLQSYYGVSFWSPNAPDSALPWWSAVALLVTLVGRTVEDLHALFYGSVDKVALTEALYCLATFLLHFQRTYGLCHGLHYRVYYVLHIMERPGTATLNIESRSGQQSLWKFREPEQRMRFTHEQMRIINHELAPTDVVRILAFAGTGKTSTLVEYARLRPAAKFLCIVYNRSVCEIAKQTFPGNVTCSTAHSLAFRAVGFQYKAKLSAKVRVLDVSKLVSAPSSTRMPRLRFAKLVLSSVENFLASADPQITVAHVPDHAVALEEDGLPVPVHPTDKLAVCEAASQLWARMKDRNDEEARMTHDGYLKLYQLRQPSLDSYDAIFVDEAQDCNPAMLSLVLSQPCAKLLVGDPHQQIYSFRRAVDALSSVPATHTFCLTQSFRFGPEIGYVASCALEVFKGITNKTIVGTETPGSIHGPLSGQVAVLARSNLVLFNMAVDIVCNEGYKQLGLSHVRGAFVGGIAGYGFQQILDIYYLKYRPDEAPSMVQDPFVKRFASYSALYKYAHTVEDLDLCSKLAFVNDHCHDVPRYVQALRLRCTGDQRLANVVFSTAHKAKGLEFDTVFMADDFYTGDIAQPQLMARTPERLEEYHVLYVAVTRARRCLRLSRALYFLLIHAQECFEHLSPTTQAEPLTCLVCQNTFVPRGQLVWSRDALVVGNRDVAGGPLCKSCALETTWEPPVEHRFLGWQHMELQNVHRQSMAAVLECVL
uniref:F-box protein helicase 18 n=1 Tax=Rhipicephalus zambeziensis TaxID=60191 RepID=A0A224YT28_9ACAR